MPVKENVKLEEGHKYPFKISGIIDLPDGNEYFVLKDPNNVRHLLLTRYYKNFNFQLGKTIQCRIDKINCSGKIYLEPEHPNYKLGYKYDFPFKYIEDYKDNVGKLHRFAIFTDVFENEIKMPLDVLPEKIEAGVSLNFKISRIKKGMVYLSSNGLKEDYKRFEDEKYYYFRIVQFRLYPDNRSFYILNDENGYSYKLRSKFFEKYDFKIGQSIQCRLVRTEEEIYLEPKHPYYNIGNQYDFEIITEELIEDYPNGKTEAYLLKNDFGKSVHIPKRDARGIISDGKLKCLVIDIKKSRLYLKC